MLNQINKSWWQEIPATKNFLEKAKELGASEKQLEVLTPVVIPSSKYEEMRKAYLLSTKKIKKMYLVPAISLGHTIYYKNTTWFVYPLFYLNEWLDFLMREINYKLPTEIYKPDKFAEKVVEKEIKFFIKPEEKAFVAYPKVRIKGKALGYETDEPLKVKEVR